MLEATYLSSDVVIELIPWGAHWETAKGVKSSNNAALFPCIVLQTEHPKYRKKHSHRIWVVLGCPNLMPLTCTSVLDINPDRAAIDFHYLLLFHPQHRQCWRTDTILREASPVPNRSRKIACRSWLANPMRSFISLLWGSHILKTAASRLAATSLKPYSESRCGLCQPCVSASPRCSPLRNTHPGELSARCWIDLWILLAITNKQTKFQPRDSKIWDSCTLGPYLSATVEWQYLVLRASGPSSVILVLLPPSGISMWQSVWRSTYRSGPCTPVMHPVLGRRVRAARLRISCGVGMLCTRGCWNFGGSHKVWPGVGCEGTDFGVPTRRNAAVMRMRTGII